MSRGQQLADAMAADVAGPSDNEHVHGGILGAIGLWDKEQEGDGAWGHGRRSRCTGSRFRLHRGTGGRTRYRSLIAEERGAGSETP